MPYIVHYENRLLDDLHNLFPAILYEPDAFRTVSDLLYYVRGRVRSQMDLFSAAQMGYAPVDRSAFPSYRVAGAAAAAAPAPAPRNVAANPWIPMGNRTTVAPTRWPSPARQQSAAPTVTNYVQYTFDVEENPPIRRRAVDLSGAAAPIGQQPPRDSHLPTYNELNAMNSLLNLYMGGGDTGLDSLLSPLLRLGLGGITGIPPSTPAQQFMEPVVVRPTREQIAAGSVIERVDSEEEVCAICQDQMAAGSEARSLTACDHRFHIGCIDTWFQNSVRCPVCRHDIREPATDETATAEQPASELTEEELRDL